MNNISIIKRLFCVTITSCIAFASAGFSAAETPKLNKSSKSLTAGKTFTLKVSNAKKTVKWSTSNSKVAKVTTTSNKNKCKAVIKALKKGNATITAKIGKKKIKCKITVKANTSGGSGETVYIADTGTKYHYKNCRTLRASKHAVKLSWAKSHGYEACKVCH